MAFSAETYLRQSGTNTKGFSLLSSPKKNENAKKSNLENNLPAKEFAFLKPGLKIVIFDFETGKKKEFIGNINEVNFTKDGKPKNLSFKVTHCSKDKNKVGRSIHLSYVQTGNKNQFAFVITKITEGGEKKNFKRRVRIRIAA